MKPRIDRVLLFALKLHRVTRLEPGGTLGEDSLRARANQESNSSLLNVAARCRRPRDCRRSIRKGTRAPRLFLAPGGALCVRPLANQCSKQQGASSSPKFRCFPLSLLLLPVFSEEKATRSSRRREGQMRGFRRQRCSHNFKRPQVVSEGFSTLEQAVRCSVESRRGARGEGIPPRKNCVGSRQSQRRQETKSGKVKVCRATKL